MLKAVEKFNETITAPGSSPWVWVLALIVVLVIWEKWGQTERRPHDVLGDSVSGPMKVSVKNMDAFY